MGAFRRAASTAMFLALGAVAIAQPADSVEDAARAFDAGQFGRAAEGFRRATVADPNNPRAWFGLGKSFEALARQSFSALQKLAPGSEWEALLVADVWVTAGRFTQALSLYREVLKQHPDLPGVHASVAHLYELAGHREWAATERAREPARADTCAAAAADCLFLAGRHDAAVKATLRAQDAPSLYWRIRALNALATDAFASLDALPASAEVHLVRAAIDRDQGRPLDAVPELKAALALRPGDREIEEDLAVVLYESKNLDEALPLLERLAGAPGKAEPEWAFFYGDALLQGQQVERALPYLEAAAARRPDAPAVRASLGRALLQSGDATAALPHLQAAAEAEDDDSDGAVHYQLAQAYQRLGRSADARSALAEYQKRQTAATPNAAATSGEPAPSLTPP